MSILTKQLQEALVQREFLKITPNDRLIVRLIYEDMKAHHFFEGLRTLGLDDIFHQPELGSIILDYIGLTDVIPDSHSFYYDLKRRHSKGMKADIHIAADRSINVYADLIAAKKQ